MKKVDKLYSDKLKQAVQDERYGEAHMLCDTILCEILSKLGYSETVSTYKVLSKEFWYE